MTLTRFRQARLKTETQQFFQQLMTLCEAGIILTKSLSIISQLVERREFKIIILSLKQELEKGNSFHQALQQFPSVFDHFSCRLVAIGEQSGTFTTMLQRICLYQEQRLSLKRELQQALIYPCILLVAAVATILCLLLFVLPHFALLFENYPQQLPLLTRLLLGLAPKLQALAQTLLFSGLGVFIYFKMNKKNQKNKSWQSYALKIPLIKTLVLKKNLTDFARNLATALGAAIPLSEALILLAALFQEGPLRKSIQQLQCGIQQGQSFYKTLSANPLFPTLLVQMVKTGEEAGRLELMLAKFASLYELELKHQLRTWKQVLEPLIILGLGVLIGGIVIAMYLPIFRLGTVLS